MFRKVYPMLISVAFLTLASCLPTTTPNAPLLPEDEFSQFDKFGDGFIAKIKIKDTESFSSEQIVSGLVEQWLEHYKYQSDYENATINDYTIDKIRLLDVPSNSNYTIVAGVNFSIIPRNIPSDFGGFPGEEYDPNSLWWHIAAPFGVIQVGDYYYLRLVFGWGT
jgi:hypothetical protein